MTVSAAPQIIFRYFDNNGAPLAGGLVYTYVSGSSTPLATYSDASGAVPNTNPVVLDSAGYASINLLDTAAYRFVIKTAQGVTIRTVDNIVSATPTVDASIITTETVTATQGQTLIPLVNAYTIGGNSLEVSLNGAVQVYNVDYTETSTNSITMATGLNAGDVIYARVFSTSIFTAPAADQVVYGASNVAAALDTLFLDTYYNQGGTGAVTRLITTRLRDLVSVKDFGAVGDGVTDDTAAFALALAASLQVYVPVGTYLVTSITLNRNGHSLITEGFGTVFQQKPGSGLGIRVINVTNSNVTVGTCSVMGNIATDTNEQNHAVFINSNSSTGNLSNITVGDIKGTNLRGDVLYIGAFSGYLTSYVSFGRIIGTNIYRNVVSITGATYVTGDACISDGATGLFTLDIEPDTVQCHDITVKYVRGCSLGVLPATAGITAFNINIGFADMNPAYAPDSTPAYPLRYARSALNLRNTTSFVIGQLKAKDHTHFAVEYIWNGGEQRGQNIEIGYLESNNVGSGDVTYNAAIQATAIDTLTIRSAKVTLNNPATDALVLGDSSGSTFTRVIIDKLSINGQVGHYVKNGRFTNIIASTASPVSAFFHCDDCTIMDSEITVPTLINFSSNTTFINVKATASTAYYGSTVSGMTRINCTFGGVTTGLVTSGPAAAALTGEIAYGSTVATTVGAAGGASALPATPTGYIIINVAGTDRKIPYYAN